MDLTVIVPIYNVEQYILPCLDSIARAAGGLETEVILVDDGSTDSSGALAEEYAETHKGFHYYYKENGGIGSARNMGAEKAKGKYIAFADADDLVADGIYEDMYRAAEFHGTDMAICHAARIKDGRVSASDIHLRAFHNIEGGVAHITPNPQLVYDSTAWNKLIRRDFYERNSFRWPEGVAFEDIPVTIRMHYRANGVAIVRETGYFWRIRSEGGRSLTQQFKSTANLSDKIEMIGRAFAFLDEEVRDERIRTALEQKAAMLDFSRYIYGIADLRPAQAISYMARLREFFAEYIRPETVGTLRLIWQQIWKDIAEGDLDHLKRTVNYNKEYYSGAPVLHVDGQYRLDVPGEIFKIEDRSVLNEFRDTPPTTIITDAEEAEGCVTLKGFLYYRRIECPTINDQQLSAYLLNDITGETRDIELRQFASDVITQERGAAYNYDGAGWEALIRPEDVPAGRNKLMIRYDGPVGCGVRITRGIRDEAKNKLKGMTANGALTFGFDARDTLDITADDRQESGTE